MTDESSLRAELNERRPPRREFSHERGSLDPYVRQGSRLLEPLRNDHEWKAPLENRGIAWQEFQSRFAAVSEEFVRWNRQNRGWTDAVDAPIDELADET